jgi:hypothetical protein
MLKQNQIEKLESMEVFMEAAAAVREAAEALEGGELGQGPGKAWRLTEKTAPVDPESAPVVFDYLLTTDDSLVGRSKATNKSGGYKPLYNKGYWIATRAAADASGRTSSRRSAHFQVPGAALDVYSDAADDPDDVDGE